MTNQLKTSDATSKMYIPMSKELPSSNVYRVGDYVYVETMSNQPYQIRRIEELTKTNNGQVEAKVLCFYRRRDVSSAIVSQADKHAESLEEDGELTSFTCEDPDLSHEIMHQTRHRELFLSRQMENINANTIRGKCFVVLYNEVESLVDFNDKEDWFYYLLVYDPVQKIVFIDHGEIQIGDNYQTKVEELDDNSEKMEHYRDINRETLVWKPNMLTDNEIDDFLIISKSVGTYARSLDITSTVKDSSLHSNAQAASRDTAMLYAMNSLHRSEYNIANAISSGLLSDGSPILCIDQLEDWNPSEIANFETLVQKTNKDFSHIQQEYLPWRTCKNIVEFYYMWKTTDRYLNKKKRLIEEDKKVGQIYIPKNNNNSINLSLSVSSDGKSNMNCEGCFSTVSNLWYPWGPLSSTCKLSVCKNCWVYWKKYGGLKKPPPVDFPGGPENHFKCPNCNKRFSRFDRLSSHMVVHRSIQCLVSSCEKTFDSQWQLNRHLLGVHNIRNQLNNNTESFNNIDKPAKNFHFSSSKAWKRARLEILTSYDSNKSNDNRSHNYGTKAKEKSSEYKYIFKQLCRHPFNQLYYPVEDEIKNVDQLTKMMVQICKSFITSNKPTSPLLEIKSSKSVKKKSLDEIINHCRILIKKRPFDVTFTTPSDEPKNNRKKMTTFASNSKQD